MQFFILTKNSNIPFTILTFKCTVLCTFTLSYSHHFHSSPELFYFPQLKLCPLNTNFPFPIPPVSGNHHSTFCLYEFDFFRSLIGTINMVPFCDRLISLSIMYSRFIHSVAYVRIPFLFKDE